MGDQLVPLYATEFLDEVFQSYPDPDVPLEPANEMKADGGAVQVQFSSV
jgi:hypothetical protein